MRHPRFYTVVLTLLLIAQCWLFNVLARNFRVLGVFPWPLGLIVVPIVMFAAGRQKSRSSGGATPGALRRFGWSVLWPASLAFASFFAALSAFNFGPGHFWLVIFGFVAALSITLVLGVASTEAAGLIGRKATSGTARNSAA